MTNPVDHQPPSPDTTGAHVIPFPTDPPPAMPDEDPYLAHLDQQPNAGGQPTRLDTTAPHNPDAERAVLGALIADQERLADVRPLLTAGDFYQPIHEELYQLITDMADHDQPVDMVTIGDRLLRGGALANPSWRHAGGLPYLLQLTQACPITANAEAYAGVVRDYARRRTLTTLGTQLGALARNPDTSAEATSQAILDGLDVLDHAFKADTTTAVARTGHTYTDLSWILDGKPPAQVPPAWVRRADGTALFYNGRVNGLFGDPEGGKTWIAQIAIIEALDAGQRAAMIDVDHNGADHSAARLLLLGARLEDLANPDLFRYYEPEDGDQLRDVITDAVTFNPAVTVLDSIGEMLPMLGVKSVDNDEITNALRTIVMPLAKAGSCVITIDHLPKSVEARATGYAIGGTAKKRAMDGAYIRVEAKVKPVPGGIGRVMLRIEKDRTGELRKSSGGGYAGTLTLDSTHSETEGITRWSIGREDSPITTEGKFRPTHLMEKVSRFVEDNDQATGADIARAKFGKAEHVRAAIQCLIEEGFISPIAGPRNSTLHHSTAIYRESEDDTN